MASRMRHRSGHAIVVALALFSAGCSVEDSLPIPDCVRGGSAIIVAQSVPTADLIPCFGPLPTGWEVDTIKIDQDGTAIRFDSDRAGEGAAGLHYADTCDTAEAVPVPSDQDGADRFDNVESGEPGDPGSLRGQRYYVFAGGCVWWDFDFVGADDSVVLFSLSLELAKTLSLMTRDSLNELIRETFIDEEL